jgi:hypothetical protein
MEQRPKRFYKNIKGLKPEDIQACFLFATRSLGDTDFMPLTVETV